MRWRARIIRTLNMIGGESGIAQRHVEALGADGRDHMRRFAHQHDAMCRELPRHQALHRKGAAPADIRDQAQFTVNGELDFAGEVLAGKCHEFGGTRRAFHPHQC